MNIHIETERCILRDIEESDVDGLFELDSDPEVNKFLGNRPLKTIDEAEKIIRFIRKQYQENGIGRWAIIDKETHDFMGWTGLKLESKIRKEVSYYDLGYRLKKEYWGKGIGTETARASLHYGFNQLALHEICAAAHIHNEASNRILQKIGLDFIETFEYDGATHNWYKMRKSDFLELIQNKQNE